MVNMMEPQNCDVLRLTVVHFESVLTLMLCVEYFSMFSFKDDSKQKFIVVYYHFCIC
jgi:hypothetical protein